MIHGVVNARHEATVPMMLRGPDGAQQEVQAIVDSGFNAALALPFELVSSLGLVRRSSSGAVMADGSIRQFDVYAAEVAWTDGWRPLLVTAVGEEVLLGMRLLAGHELRIAVVPGGSVGITPLE